MGNIEHALTIPYDGRTIHRKINLPFRLITGDSVCHSLIELESEESIGDSKEMVSKIVSDKVTFIVESCLISDGCMVTCVLKED